MRFFPQHIDHAATQRSTGPLLPNQRFGALCRIISCGISTCRPGRLSFLRTALGGMRFFPQHIDHAATQRSIGPLLPNQRFGALCRIISCGISTCRPGRLSFLRTALGGMRFFPQHIDHAATQRSIGPLLPNQRFGALCRIISCGISTCRPGRLNFFCTALGGMRFLPQHIDHAATQRSTGPLLPNQRFGALCRIISCGISTCRPEMLRPSQQRLQRQPADP